jgi:hypothetical protein
MSNRIQSGKANDEILTKVKVSRRGIAVVQGNNEAA